MLPQDVLKNARKGLLNETILTAPGLQTDGLGACCRQFAKGNYNSEVLCYNHMRTFEGFLDMIEDPKKDNKLAVEGNASSVESQKHHNNLTTPAITFSPENLRNSPSCQDKHWSPVTSWRMEHKFYPQLNFIGHLETAQLDIHRLLNGLHQHPGNNSAWEKYGESGWGKFHNESMFESATTVKHSKKAKSYLFDHYARNEIERRVEKIYEDDYNNAYLDLERVPVGEAEAFYKKRYLERYGSFG